MSNITNPEIKVMDRNDIITIAYEDLIKYHGYNMIGGVALAYKIMCWGFPKLTSDIPKRGLFSFLSGIGPGGEGVIDAVEMVMRVKTYNTLCLDVNLVKDKPGALTPGDGRYYFELGYDGKVLCLALRDGIVPQEFYDFSRMARKHRLEGTTMTDEESKNLMRVRQNLADAILSSNADDLFFVVSCK